MLTVAGWPVRRRYDYTKYLLGITRSEHVFRGGTPRRITIVIPDSLGDVAINASVTRYYRESIPGLHISLITHPRYVPAGDFVPEYDEVIGYGGRYAGIPSGQLTHSQQINIARLETPGMDRLYLAQPSAWCDAVSARYSMLEMQNRLCKVPEGVRHMPRLTAPAGAVERAKQVRARHPGPAVFVARGAYTITHGETAERYCRLLVGWCAERGVHVYWNDVEPIIDHEHCTAVGREPLADAVALAALSDAVVSMRSGFSDLVGFVARDLPHRVVYPPGNYPYSKLSWLEQCSLQDMGVTGADEQVVALCTPAEADAQVDRTRDWMCSVPALAAL